jgi:hypothetical protein
MRAECSMNELIFEMLLDVRKFHFKTQ